MNPQSIQILRLNAEYDALIHAAKPLLHPGDQNTNKATRWIQYLSKPVNNFESAENRVKQARQLLRKLKNGDKIDSPPEINKIYNSEYMIPRDKDYFSDYNSNLRQTNSKDKLTFLNLPNEFDYNESKFKNDSGDAIINYKFDKEFYPETTKPDYRLRYHKNSFSDKNSVKSQQTLFHSNNFDENVSNSNFLSAFDDYNYNLSNNGELIQPETKISDSTFLQQHDMISSMHEYKLQLQKASDLAMEKIIEKKNEEILNLKAKFNDNVSGLENELGEVKLSRDTFKNQVLELEKGDSFMKAQIEQFKSNQIELKLQIENLTNVKVKYENDKNQNLIKYQKQIQNVVDSTTSKLKSLEHTMTIKEQDNQNTISNLKNELENSNESKNLTQDLVNNLKIKLEQLNKQLVDESAKYNTKMIEMERNFGEKLTNLQMENSELKSTQILKISELESNYKKDLTNKESELNSKNLQVNNYKQENEKLKEQVENYQKEVDEILEQADEKIHLLKDEKEQAIKVVEKECEGKILCLTEKMTKEKTASINAIKLEYDSEKRMANLESEKIIELEQQKYKMLEEKFDSVRQKMNDDVKNFEQEKSKIIQQFTIQLKQNCDALDAARKEKNSIKAEHDKIISSIENANNTHIQDLKEQTAGIQLDLNHVRKLKDQDNLKHAEEVRSLNKRINLLEQELFISTENLTQSEETKEKLNQELNNLEKKRRQQLLELGILREQEKQDSEKKNLENFQKAELQLRNEMKIRLEDKLANLRKRHRKDLNLVDSQLKDVERKYSDKCSEYVQRTKESEKLVMTLKKAKNKIDADCNEKMSRLKAEFEETLHNERSVMEDKLAEINAECELEKARSERTERRLEQAEVIYRNEIDDLKIKFNKDTEDLLPKTIQAEFENTIEDLRGQLKTLHKTVRDLMAKQKVLIKNGSKE